MDILNYERKRQNWRGCGARRESLDATDELEGGKHPTTTKEDKRTTYAYPVVVVHDPLEIGGFIPGASFSAYEFRTMKQFHAFTPGTQLLVRGVLRRICKDGKLQVSRKVV